MNLDLNLLPKSSKRLSNLDVFLLILIILGILCALGYLGFYVPLQSKINLQQQIANRENDIAVVTEQVKEYTSLLELIAIQEDKNNVIKSIKSDYTLMSGMLIDIEESMSQAITVKQISLTSTGMELTGYSPDYNNIAQFEVNLRNKNYFTNVSFNNARLDSGEIYEFSMNILTETESGNDEQEALDNNETE